MNIPNFPVGLIRPWRALYRKRASRGRRFYGGGMLLAVAAVAPFIWLVRVCVMIYGTAIWGTWVYIVCATWLFIALYACLAILIVHVFSRFRNRRTS